MYASRKIFIDAQLADRGGVPRLKFKDALRAVMYADRDGFLQPMGWEGWTAWAQATFTQTNVAGGAIVVDITPGAGNEFDVMTALGQNSGTNTVQMLHLLVNGTAQVFYVAVASAAATTGTFPHDTQGGTTTGSIVSSIRPVIVSGREAFTIQQTGAGVQNDTMVIQVRVRLKHKSQLPTVSIARSTNPGSVTGTLTFAVEE